MPGVASAIPPDARRLLVIVVRMLLPSEASLGKSRGHNARRLLVRREHRGSRLGLILDSRSEDGGEHRREGDKEHGSLVPLRAPRCRSVPRLFTHALRDIVKARGFCF